MTDITNLFGIFKSLFKTFVLSDLVDIIVVSFIIYNLIKIIRETRAGQLVKGILILLLAYVFSSYLKLKVLTMFLNTFIQFGVIALLIVFQPELRRMLEQLGRNKFGEFFSLNVILNENNSSSVSMKKTIDAVVEACEVFSRDKVGALIVFERKTKLGDILNSGTIINATPSSAIIGNIFFNKAPLHDGALIIRNATLYAAGCILPLAKNDNISIDLGTRHRAAIGMSENSDAVVLVVSEETGNISIAVNGMLKRNYTPESLKYELEGYFIKPEDRNNKIKKNIKKNIMCSFKKVKKIIK